MAKANKQVPEQTEQPATALMLIEMWAIDRPKPYPKNARTWTAQDVEQVAISIRKFGFRQPIVVDKEGVIIVGHLRLAGARLAGYTEVPVHVASDLSPEQVKAYRLADNKVGELAEWVPDMLASDFLDLRIADFDISSTGFDVTDIVGSVFGDLGAKKKDKKKAPSAGGYKEQYGVIVMCMGEEDQQTIYEKLVAMGYACKIVVT